MGGSPWAQRPRAKSAPCGGRAVSPHGRRVKCPELNSGESQAGPAHPESLRPGWGRCRGAVLEVRTAAAAHDPPSRRAGGAARERGPTRRARRQLVPNTRGDPRPEHKERSPIQIMPLGIPYGPGRSGELEAAESMVSPPAPQAKSSCLRESEIKRLVRVGTPPAGPVSAIYARALASRYNLEILKLSV